MAVHEAESRRTGGHGRQTEQSSRRGHCGAQPHLADVVDRAVPSELLCICWLRNAAAEVPDFGIRARTVCNAGDPVGRLPSFPDGDFRPIMMPVFVRTLSGAN